MRVAQFALAAREAPTAVLRLGLACLLLFSMSMGSARAEMPPWRWPLPPPHQVIAPFDAPVDRYGPGHRGIDIAAPAAGAPVHAVAPGTVRFSGMVAGRGVVSVAHADGLISTYEPVAGTVTAGEQVEAGTELGTIVDTSELSHCPGAICLHLGARRGEDYVDPMLLLGDRGPSVLLPWTGEPAGGGDADGAPATTAGGHSPSAGRSPPSMVSGVRGSAAEAPGSAAGKSIAGPGVHDHRPRPRQASLA